MWRAPSILFVHDNYPAQFGAIGRWLADRGWDVAFATAARAPDTGGLRVLSYAPHRPPSRGTHPYAQPMDRAALRAQAFVRAALAARREGYRPDIVVAHSGWGAGMFAKDVFPDAAFVAYCEWWYRHPGPDVVYLAALEGRTLAPAIEAPMHERARNAPMAMDLAAADAALCPTEFQAAQFPPIFRRALAVLHDGVDTGYYRPEPAPIDRTLGGRVAEDARVVTYATRGMEPHRGFPQFMAALPAILADPKAVAVVAGDNRVAYGGDALRRIDWKAEALARHDIDPARVRFVGHLDPPSYRALLRRSDAHVYLTVPFVLSWSMLEAMSCGCSLVLSDTAPIREFADPGSALLVEMGDSRAITAAVQEAFSDGEGSARRRTRARARIESSVAAATQFPRKEQWFLQLTG